MGTDERVASSLKIRSYLISRAMGVLIVDLRLDLDLGLGRYAEYYPSRDSLISFLYKLLLHFQRHGRI